MGVLGVLAHIKAFVFAEYRSRTLEGAMFPAVLQLSLCVGTNCGMTDSNFAQDMGTQSQSPSPSKFKYTTMG